MIALLKENPLLLLFLVAALGYLIGRIRVAGFGLGVAAVLFVGLAVSSRDPDLKLPELVGSFGLVLFVYTIGVAGGPGFFASFRRRGLAANALALGLLLFATGLTASLRWLLHLDGPLAAGMFAGSLTNTPALAGVLQTLRDTVPGQEALLARPVVAYSVTYPAGVVGVLLSIWLMKRIWGADGAPSSESGDRVAGELVNQTVRVSRAEAMAALAHDLCHEHGLRALFGRMKRGEHVSVVTAETRFQEGDLVVIVGDAASVRAATALLGEAVSEHLDLDRRALDYRRIFVSAQSLSGKLLRELALPARFGATVTRIRRGDVDLLPDDDTVLELGDRIRVVGPRERMDEVSKFFGDSYKALAEVDVVTFSLGIALGLALGMVPIPLPAGASFKLGAAGGPLIVGLLLGRLGRTGPMVWTLPYSANLTLRQLGLVLFLASVGTRSGYAFATTFAQGGGLAIFAAGAVITCVTALGGLWIGHRVLRIPRDVLLGVIAGVHTQPAALAFAVEQTGNEQPNLGYSTVFPLATIAKIVLAQLLLALLR
jgi:putative transport protein